MSSEWLYDKRNLDSADCGGTYRVTSVGEEY